jgi:hypothetical protein
MLILKFACQRGWFEHSSALSGRGEDSFSQCLRQFRSGRGIVGVGTGSSKGSSREGLRCMYVVGERSVLTALARDASKLG